MTVGDKLKFLFMHVLHIYREDIKAKLKPLWNDFFGCWNKFYESSEDDGVADACLICANDCSISFHFLKDQIALPYSKNNKKTSYEITEITKIPFGSGLKKRSPCC
jgi:hypothetical protein